MKPLWTDSSIEMIEGLLFKDMHVFEWGSGTSTIWLAKRVNRIITLEHSQEWYDKVAKWVKEYELQDKVTQIMRDITSGDYMTPIITAPDEYFDMIVIDGAFRRVEAFERSIPKCKRNGVIILGDSQNRSYSGIFLVEGVEVNKESTPDNTGKKMTVFRRL